MARKTGIMGTSYITETRPKKTRQGRVNTRNTPLPLVTRLVKDIGGKVASVYVNYQSTFL